MEQKTQSFVAVLTGIHRMNNSPSGNPRWRLSMEAAGSSETQADAQINHEIESRQDYIGKRVQFTANMAGRIVDVELAD